MMENNINFFNAQVAKERTIESKEKRLQKSLESIYKEINTAIYNGKNSITLNYFISDLCKEFLIDKGFKVNFFSGDQRDPCEQTNIYW